MMSLLSLLCLSVARSLAADMPTPMQISEDKLNQYDREVDHITNQYINTIKRAIAANEDPQLVGLYIRALSRLKSRSAIPLLIDNITYSTRRDGPGNLPTHERDHPCIYALIQIGLPALEPLLERAKVNDESSVQAAIATVVYQSLGVENSKAIIGVKLQHEKDEAKSMRLRSLINEIERKASPRRHRPRGRQ